jgi:hypothetical protein
VTPDRSYRFDAILAGIIEMRRLISEILVITVLLPPVGCDGKPTARPSPAPDAPSSSDTPQDDGASPDAQDEPQEALDAGVPDVLEASVDVDSGPWNPLGEYCNGSYVFATSCGTDLQQWAVARNQAVPFQPICPPQDNLAQPTIWALSDAGYDNKCLFYCDRGTEGYCSLLFAGHCKTFSDAGQGSVCVP